MENKNYSFRIAWSDEDQGFIATCPELPGLSAFGETEDQALTEAQIAKGLFIRDLIDSGESLPEPQTVQTYSGQTRLRLPKSLHRVAVEMAQEEDVSLNQYIVDALRARVTGEQVASRALREVKQCLWENRVTAASLVSSEAAMTRYKRKTTEEEISIEQPLYTSPLGTSRKGN